jgi:Protein of unknown function (DUF2877).
MVYILAQVVTAELRNELNANIYKVQSVYEHGFNICIGEGMCFVGNKNNQKVPYSIILEKGEVSKCINLISPDHSTFHWNKDTQELHSQDVVICLKDIHVYDSKIQKALYPLDINKWSMFIHKVPKDFPTGFGTNAKTFLGDYHEELEELQEAFVSTDIKKVRNGLKKWVGRGIGLTPSGDDFLIGILYINHGYPFITALFFQELEKLLEQEYTTRVSTHYLRCAMKGLYSETLKEVLQRIEEGNVEALDKSIKHLEQFGHTSGHDTMLGILSGLSIIIK